MRNHKIVIYSDPKSRASTGSLAQEFQKSLGEDTAIIPVTAEQLLHGNVLNDNISAFVLPGIIGEESLYYNHIGERGNTVIRTYVERGGVFMGLCAGAYYAASTIEYKPQWANHRGHSTGLLTLFNGIARGPVPNMGISATTTDAYNGCTTVPVLLDNGDRPEIAYSCGPAFYTPGRDATILANYDTPHSPVAAFSLPVGLGRVILSGVLPQYGTPDNWEMPQKPHPVDMLMQRLQPHEQGRRYLWNRMTAFIADRNMPFPAAA